MYIVGLTLITLKIVSLESLTLIPYVLSMLSTAISLSNYAASSQYAVVSI